MEAWVEGLNRDQLDEYQPRSPDTTDFRTVRNGLSFALPIVNKAERGGSQGSLRLARARPWLPPRSALWSLDQREGKHWIQYLARVGAYARPSKRFSLTRAAVSWKSPGRQSDSSLFRKVACRVVIQRCSPLGLWKLLQIKPITIPRSA